MSEVLGVPVTPVDQPEDAIRGADIAMCGSNSTDPIYFKRWIEPGVASVVDQEARDRAGRDPRCRQGGRAHARHRAHPRRRQGREVQGGRRIPAGTPPTISTSTSFRRCPISSSAGAVGARFRPPQVTCFLNNLGMGYQFAAAGSVIYKRAREQGVGHELPTDWFTETVHP